MTEEAGDDFEVPWDALGRAYERTLGDRRKASGVYYTPPSLVRHVTAGAFRGRRGGAALPRAVDPACGCGAMLLGAYDALLRRRRAAALATDDHAALRPGTRHLALAERARVLTGQVFGVELDPDAAAVARCALWLRMTDGAADDEVAALPASVAADLAMNVRGGDALAAGFAGLAEGAFDVVVGNPPWGQKRVAVAASRRRGLRERFPSSAGIFDLFRPFVELSVRLLRPGGRLGLVLPDVLLLKDYPATREYLLGQTRLDAIDWWGMAFDGATIDAVTLLATRGRAPASHRVRVAVHDPRRPVAHRPRQADFARNPRCAFNLHVTDAARAALDRLARLPKLGDAFEVHEGVHSGNVRRELFVDAALDETCRPLLFGRDEIAPHALRWRGKFVRLGAAPPRGTPGRYANLGRPAWHAREKVLVRRTGDRVIAAVDRAGRHASNNFFLVLPRERAGDDARARPCGLSLDGLCALLNSAWMTAHFRLVEPRRGRAFAEMKIKHLTAFPLPAVADDAGACAALNDLGARRASASGTDAGTLDERIEAEVSRLLGEPAAGTCQHMAGGPPIPARGGRFSGRMGKRASVQGVLMKFAAST